MSDTWYFVNLARTNGIHDALLTVMGEGFHSEETTDPAVMVENARREVIEGMEAAMQNKREHGFNPTDVFLAVMDNNNAPESVRQEVAESQFYLFEGAREERSQEEQEYLEFLEETAGIE